jgi:hypothetical protein
MTNPFGKLLAAIAWGQLKPWLIGGGVLVAGVGILILWQSAMKRSYERGRDEAYAQVREASQVVADSWRARVEDAEVARVAAEAKAEATAANVIKETRTYYAQNPSAGAARSLPDARVVQAQAARDAVLSASAGRGDDPLPKRKPANPADR